MMSTIEGEGGREREGRREGGKGREGEREGGKGVRQREWVGEWM
jgi:hypothetical protein